MTSPTGTLETRDMVFPAHANHHGTLFAGQGLERMARAAFLAARDAAGCDVVMAAVTDDKDDWRYELLQDNLRRLRETTDAKGRKLEVITLPMPAILEITEDEAWGIDSAEGTIPRRPGDKTAASYLNFLIVNGGIILPTFDDPYDNPARGIVAGAFPDREVVTVPGREIVLGGGNVHCITQQQPRG